MSVYPSELRSFAAKLPVPLYAVGGFVRDTLLGKDAHDIDLASALLPEQIQALAEESGIACPLVNRKLGTVLLCIGTERYEHTTFRTESYPSGGAHMPESVSFTDSLSGDAFRRDFSVNALYQNILTGELTDPTGGLSDLKKRVLRTTTPDPFTILKDDGLRILRMVRFAADTGFTIDSGTWQCACDNLPLLADIAWERKQAELNRMLVMPDPMCVLTLLKESGALFHLIPELKASDGLQQRSDYHRYDVLMHSLHTCAEMPADVPLRLMGLLHDIGKPSSFAVDGNYYRHAAYSDTLTDTVLHRLKYASTLISRVRLAVRNHMFDLDEKAKTSTVRKRFVSLGKQGSDDLIQLREGDIRGSGYQLQYRAARWRTIYDSMLRDGCPWKISDLKIDGKAIMDQFNLPPSKTVSAVLGHLLEHCVSHPRDNEPERLLSLARDYLGKVRTNC